MKEVALLGHRSSGALLVRPALVLVVVEMHDVGVRMVCVCV